MKIGCLYRIGGKKGMIMRCIEIDGDSAVFVTDDHHCRFFYHKGDCSIFPVKTFEQLKLF